VLVCGVVMIAAFELDITDLKNAWKCSCPLTIRNGEPCGGDEPCNYVVFTSASLMTIGGLFFGIALLNLIKGYLDLYFMLV